MIFHPAFQSICKLIINKQNINNRTDDNKGMITAPYNGINAENTKNKRLFFLNPVDIVNGYIKILQFGQRHYECCFNTFHMESVFSNQYTQKTNWNSLRNGCLYQMAYEAIVIAHNIFAWKPKLRNLSLCNCLKTSLPLFLQNPLKTRDINSCYKGKTVYLASKQC